MTQWEVNAKIAEKSYGMQVDREEEFYICPDCGEPIYRCDYEEELEENPICPVCGFEMEM